MTIDPNALLVAALAAARNIGHRINNTDMQIDPDIADMLVSSVVALDSYLTNGGNLPLAWSLGRAHIEHGQLYEAEDADAYLTSSTGDWVLVGKIGEDMYVKAVHHCPEDREDPYVVFKRQTPAAMAAELVDDYGGYKALSWTLPGAIRKGDVLPHIDDDEEQYGLYLDGEAIAGPFDTGIAAEHARQTAINSSDARADELTIEPWEGE